MIIISGKTNNNYGVDYMLEKMKTTFLQGVDFSHFLLRKFLKEGDIAVDATAGNGRDTEFMAKLVGSTGKVYAFDIQKNAIENTGKLLQKKNLSERVNLIHENHKNINKYIDEEIVTAVIFNLGFLPGGNKEIITRPDTTLAALKSSLKVIISGGIIVLVIYCGHKGGKEEKDTLINFCENLDYKLYNVLHYQFINQKNFPPQVLAIEKR